MTPTTLILVTTVLAVVAALVSVNVLKVGATRKGKTLSAARDVTESDEAAVILDPHKQSLAEAVLTHATGNILYEKLSDISLTLGFDFLSASTNSNPMMRHLENQRRAEAFVEILLRRRGGDGIASTPLMEEWVMAAIMLFLYQSKRKPLPWLPFAFLPGTSEFRALVQNCMLPEIRHKFQQLEPLSPRALRSEVGSATRLVNSVFRSPAFVARCRGGFCLPGFLQEKGKLIIECGDDIGDDTMRVIMGAIILLVIDIAKRRAKPYPPIRVYIDEATNAGLVGKPELKGLAETNKNGLYWTLLVQNLDFPGGSDAVIQNSHRHEWFGCPFYDLARKGAIDVLAGLPVGEESRAQRLEQLTTEIMMLPAGWRWVRDMAGSRKEYVPLLENGWPDWPGLRAKKLEEKLEWIYARPEYRTCDTLKNGDDETPPSSISSNDTPPPPPSLPTGSSPAERWRRAKRKPADGLPSSGVEGGSH